MTINNASLRKLLTGFLYGFGGGIGLSLAIYLFTITGQYINDLRTETTETRTIQRSWPKIEEVTAKEVRHWQEGQNLHFLISVQNNSEFSIVELFVEVEFYNESNEPVDEHREIIHYQIKSNEIENVKFTIKNIKADYKTVKFKLFNVS